MRKVVDTGQVAHLWAHQAQSDARNAQGSFYFTGDTIYSYGSHFPIARIVPQGVLYTTETYSVTTSKHLGLVRQAIPSSTMIYQVPKVLAKPDKTTMDYYRAEIAKEIGKGIKSRKYAESHFSQAQFLAQQAKGIVESFGLRCNPPTADISPAALAKGKERAKQEAIANRKANEKRAKREALQKQENERKALEQFELWKIGANTVNPWAIFGALPLSMQTTSYLRIDPSNAENVETSKQAEVPLEHVKRAYDVLRAFKARGMEWKRNGHSIHVGAFQIDSLATDGTVKAGCHSFAWAEIERFAKLQNWPIV